MNTNTVINANTLFESISKYMQTGKPITAIESLKLFHCTSNTFVTRINELIRIHKMPILSHKKTVKSRLTGRISVINVYYLKDSEYHRKREKIELKMARVEKERADRISEKKKKKWIEQVTKDLNIDLITPAILEAAN